MGNKIKNNFDQLAQSLGLRADAENCVIYGVRGAYHVIIYPQNQNNPYALTVNISAGRADGALSKEEGKEFRREHTVVQSIVQDKTVITMTLKKIANQERLREELGLTLNALVSFLQMKGFSDCCQSCGGPEPSACFASGSYVHLCQECYNRLQQDATMRSSAKKSKHENVLGGTVGALLGSMLGAASIILFSQMGYIAAVSGVILAVCTLKGYELLGGKLTNKGIVISIVLMLLMTAVGDRMDWAIAAARVLETDIATAFQLIPQLLEYEAIELSDYLGNLVMLYLFVVLGAVPTIINTLKNRKLEHKIYRLGAVDSGYGCEM